MSVIAQPVIWRATPTPGGARLTRAGYLGPTGSPGPSLISDTTALGPLTADASALFVLASNGAGTFARKITLGGVGRSLLGATTAMGGRTLLGLANVSTGVAGSVYLGGLDGTDPLTVNLWNSALESYDELTLDDGGWYFPRAMIAPQFAGDGGGLTALNASALAAGTVPSARLPIASAGALGAVRIGSGLSVDGSGILSVSGGGGMAIGGAVTGGTAGRVLYVGTGGVLAQDDGTASLTVGPRTVSGTLTMSGGNFMSAADGGNSIGGAGTGRFYGRFFGLSDGNTANEPGMFKWSSGTSGLRFEPGAFSLGTVSVFGFSSGDVNSVARDTTIHRAAAGVFGLVSGASAAAAGGTLRSTPLTPSQITADQNNYAPGVARYYRLSTDASRTLTGLSVSQVDGQECEVWNVGTNNIVLAHQSASSTAANRFICTGAANITLAADEVALLRYDATTSRWRVRKV